MDANLSDYIRGGFLFLLFIFNFLNIEKLKFGGLTKEVKTIEQACNSYLYIVIGGYIYRNFNCILKNIIEFYL
ncbi:hypothetical protein OS188_00055 [Xanthomarina sp. F1114]|uniref:hypothetical protein n=1 Tax=Xanthomarina sp. F1114 TaxID=2996019 RepID=UPI00225E4E5F|nr:hypothetical protein [Xanthomarina sp. F1114]MCX7546336.1 hypothetical protein [Xanthomarina sp. F1114]